MSPELLFWIALPLKMAVTAAFVVIASIITERAGAAVGALVSTLPVSAGPAYVFLAIDHDPAFIAQSALASLAITAATGVFSMLYVLLAQRQRLSVSLSVAFGLWLILAFVIQAVEWSLAGVLLADAIVFVLAIPLAERFRHVKLPLVTRRWFDVPLRAALVATLVATLVITSSKVGPALSGIIAAFPIVLASIMMILHPRIGGPPTAAVIANSAWGLVGYALALLALHKTVESIGSAPALMLALTIAVGWNVGIWALHRRAMLAQARIKLPASQP